MDRTKIGSIEELRFSSDRNEYFLDLMLSLCSGCSGILGLAKAGEFDSSAQQNLPLYRVNECHAAYLTNRLQ